MGQSTLPSKCCTKCGTLKPLDEFYLVSGHRESRCKDCENARRRHRDHVRYTAVSDITPVQELAMRRKARKCPMPGCGVKLTNKPGLPNSKHLDHIIPLGIHGTHTHGNVRIICAACNLKRPKDGSDYTGPVTLWAQGEAQVSRHDRRHDGGAVNKETCRKGLHPWTADNIGTVGTKRHCKACRREADAGRRTLRPCARCGAPTALPGSQAMCPACILAAVRMAACLRLADGLTWEEIAPMVGYASGTGIWYAVKRAGVTVPKPPKAAAPKQSRSACACGSPAHRHGRCEACIAETAHRAVLLRRQGWTLQRIASELGYSSITSVTNLMKTVMPIESRMGRPRKEATLLRVT